MKRKLLILLPVMLFGLSGVLCAQIPDWSGILDPSRAIDWTQAGVVGGIPDTNWVQCGSTISAYTGTAATINTRIAGCPANTYVLLGPGSFNLSTGISMKSNVVLRGSGADSTFLVMAGNNGCSGMYAWICFSQDPTWFRYAYMNTATWSGGYTQGATSITLTGLSKPLSVGQYIYLDQANDLSDPGNLVRLRVHHRQSIMFARGSSGRRSYDRRSVP